MLKQYIAIDLKSFLHLLSWIFILLQRNHKAEKIATFGKQMKAKYDN